MFPEKLKQNVLLGERICNFVQSWEKLTKYQEILEITKRCKIPLLRTPVQKKIPLNAPLKENQKFLVEKEIKEMLEKGAITKVLQHKNQHVQNQFLNNFFLIRKKDRGYRPVINLKTLNHFVPSMHFKPESLQILKYMMKERDCLCKIDLKNAYFTVPLDKSCRNLMKFLWEGNLYEFLCVCFVLRPAPRVFTKILKFPISLMHLLNMRILIYLDDILLMSQSIERLLVARDTVILLLQHLGFVINLKKSVMKPLQTIEYLGLVINLIQMTIFLREKKVKGILQECKIMFSMKEIMVLQLTQLVGVLSSTI